MSVSAVRSLVTILPPMLVAGGLALPSAIDAAPQDPQRPAVKQDPQAAMQACAIAGTPGAMHEYLARFSGRWQGAMQMWMAPPSAGVEPVEGTCTWTVQPVMGGRYLRGELKAHCEPIGSFDGLGFVGFDNAAGRFVGSWIDSHSTAIMHGEGERSADGRTLSWEYSYTCPVTRKPAILREVQTLTGEDAMTFDMYTRDPIGGDEFRCVHVDYRRAE